MPCRRWSLVVEFLPRCQRSELNGEIHNLSPQGSSSLTSISLQQLLQKIALPLAPPLDYTVTWGGRTCRTGNSSSSISPLVVPVSRRGHSSPVTMWRQQEKCQSMIISLNLNWQRAFVEEIASAS